MSCNAITGLLTTAVVASAAQATLLTFDTNTANGVDLPENYGNRVASVLQDGFTYDDSLGLTPNVTVDFATALGGRPRTWTTPFGDLTNIIYAPQSSGELRVTLTADDGWFVDLRGFDLAGWPNTDYTINGVRILTDGNFALDTGALLVRGATPDELSRRHTSFDFTDAQFRASEITIIIDFANIAAGSQDNIGLDNLLFAQTIIPGPGTAPALALLALVAARRRR
jgi:uncharacterized protein (TIGR03382 family)